MLVSVTAALDRLANVRRFVARNLAGGVDHLVVVLDDPSAPGRPTLPDGWISDRT